METKDLENILDAMQTTGVYVIREDNHRILYHNRKIQEVTPSIKIGLACHELWPDVCSCCPLPHIGTKKESRSIMYDHPFGSAVEVVATRILWENTISAILITITPYAEVASYTYSKILKANLTEDTFEIIKADPLERLEFESHCRSLGEWFSKFLEAGKIYSRDEERFRQFTDIDYLRQEWPTGKRMKTCIYRRRMGNSYRWHIMEVVSCYDYSQDNQNVMLYVKDIHDVYRKSLELEEINIRNQEIITSLGEVNYGIYVIDLHTGVMNAVRMPDDLGYINSTELLEWEDLLSKSVNDNFHPECREKMMKMFSLDALRQAWETKEQKVEMLSQRLVEGKYHYISVTAYFHDSGDNKCFVVMAFQDVDEETRKEMEKNRNLMRMATVIKSGYCTMNMVDIETGLCEQIDLKEADEKKRVHIYEYEYYAQKTMERMVFEEDKEIFRSLLSLESLRKRAEETETFSEERCQYRLQNGSSLKWMEEQVFLVRQDDTVLVNILERDITRKKCKEEATLREKQDRNYIINAMSSLFFAAYYIDLEADTFRMITQIQEVGDVLGVERNCTEGFRRYAEHFIHPEDRDEYLSKMDCHKLQQTLNKEHPLLAVEYRKAVYEDGQDGNTWIRATVVLAESGDGKAKKVLYVAQDVTESKRKEEQERRMLKEACDAANHANASKSEFLSRMSHDIRTPMNAIIGMTSIAGTHLNDKDRVSDCLSKITISSKHLLSLINEVLDMSKIESGKINLAEEEFSLPDLVQNILTIIRPAAEAKNHKMEFHIKNVEHEEVIGDMMRLQQILINIIGNAIKYTPAGGHVEIGLAERKSSLHSYGCYEFTVKDNGMGMTPEYLEKIFDPFSRAEDSRISKIEGTGLGMAIALNIARKMNGDIEVESEVNQGSKFTVTIYLKQKNAVLPDTQQLIDLPVLVADDNLYECESTCAILNEIGMKSEWVLSGREAVERVSQSHQDGKDFFVVILDWQMPDMDGLETARQIREAVGEEVPIIILSAYDWSSVENEARLAGVNGFISKPLFKSRLVYLFKQIVGDETVNETEEDESFQNTNFSGNRILLVEDNEINREIAEEVIGNFGVTVETAVDGQQAVNRFLKKGAGYYDLIFMDVQMPIMNGYEATQAIRKSGQTDADHIPIVAMTANAFAEDVMASKKAGMSEHITKPLDFDQLRECMGHWLGKKNRKK